MVAGRALRSRALRSRWAVPTDNDPWGYPLNRTGGRVGWADVEAPGGWPALPVVDGRCPLVVRDRRRLPRLPGVAPVARGVRLPRLPAPGRLAAGRRPLPLWRVPVELVGDGRDDL